MIGGYAILRVKSKEEAIELANRALEVHIKAGITDFEMEIRPLFEAADFGAELTPELREQEERQRAEIAAKK